MSRRLLVAAGTRHYAGDPAAELEQVPDEIERVRRSFEALGYTRCLAEVSQDPTARAFEEAIRGFALDTVSSGDFAVLYYTAHGVRDGDRFYLQTHDSTPGRLDLTAIPAEHLARLLVKDSRAAQVLVILDTCYSGAGSAELMQIANRIALAQAHGPALFVIASARPKEEAMQGAFSTALSQSLANGGRRLGGGRQPFLALDDVMQDIADYLRARHPSQTATWASALVHGRCQLFPNAHYRPAPAGERLQSDEDIRYFTGRALALDRIAAWLARATPPGLLVVTGGAGTGKSALLARLAASPPRAIDALVALHHCLLADVVEQLARQLSIDAPDTRALLRGIERLARPLVIVLDALDEADERGAILRLLGALVRLGNVRLIVGTQPDATARPRFRALGSASVEIDLDAGEYRDAAALETYVLRRLTAEAESERRSSYRDRPDEAAVIARAVAAAVAPSFLLAKHAADTILDAPGKGAPDGWDASLDARMDRIIDDFLARIDRSVDGMLSRDSAQALLLALAFSEGEGLPATRVMAAAAGAFGAHVPGNAEIAEFLERGAAFLVESREEERSAYRLYHELLAGRLRARAGDASAVQRRLVEALLATVPRAGAQADWGAAHPYLLRHLATHARKGGVLAALAATGGFLAHATPTRLVAALREAREPAVDPVLAIYEATWDRLRAAEAPVRAAYLRLASRQRGWPALAAALGDPRAPWNAEWVRWQADTPHQVLAERTSVITALLATAIDSAPVALAGDVAGRLELWDLAAGAPIREFQPQHRARVTAIAATRAGGEHLVASASRDSTVRLWRLATGEMVGPPVRGHEGRIEALAVTARDGAVIGVSGHASGALRIWDLVRSKSLAAPAHGHEAGVTALAIAAPEDGRIVVSGAADGSLAVWRLDDVRLLGTVPLAHADAIAAVAVARLPDGEVVLSAGRDGALLAWRLAAGRLDLFRVFAPAGGPALTACRIGGGGKLAITGDEGGSIRLFDLATGAPLGEPFRGHGRSITAVDLASDAGALFAVSAGRDRTLRVWKLDTAPMHAGAGTHAAHADWVSAVAVVSVGSSDIAVSASRDGTLAAWDGATGAALWAPTLAHAREVTHLAGVTGDDRALVVSSSRDGTVRVHDAATGRACGALGDPGGAAVTTLAAGTSGNVFTGDSTGAIAAWTVATARRSAGPWQVHEGPVRALACAKETGVSLGLSTGADNLLCLWDPATGRLVARSTAGRSPIAALAPSHRRPGVFFAGARDGSIVRIEAPRLAQTRVAGLALVAPLASLVSAAAGDREVIAAGARDGSVVVLDAEDGALLAELRLLAPVSGLAFSRGGALLVGTDRGLAYIRVAGDAVARGVAPLAHVLE